MVLNNLICTETSLLIFPKVSDKITLKCDKIDKF